MNFNENVNFSIEEATLDLVFPGAFLTDEDGTIMANPDLTDLGELAVGRKIWIQTPRIPNKKNGLIRLTDTSLDQVEMMSSWGVVRNMGPDCYRDDPHTCGIFYGNWCNVGDIVRIPSYSEIIRKKGKESIYIMANDINVISKVLDWKAEIVC